jgi:SAM-dependent methyltransferase
MSIADFSAETELPGDDVSQEQIERLCHRYYWATSLCAGKEVIEAGCGSGQGLGYLLARSRNLWAGDYSLTNLEMARAYYGTRIIPTQFDAQAMPFSNGFADTVILFEALYYLASAERFVMECRRVLRPGGKVLIATANKDLFDFNPSPHSRRYYGVVELGELFSPHGFDVEFFGYCPFAGVCFRQRALRGLKKLAVQLGFMPQTKSAKKLFRRLVFGKLVKMPSEVREGMSTYTKPTPLALGVPDKEHKVIYCAATLRPSYLAEMRSVSLARPPERAGLAC